MFLGSLWESWAIWENWRQPLVIHGKVKWRKSIYWFAPACRFRTGHVWPGRIEIIQQLLSKCFFSCSLQYQQFCHLGCVTRYAEPFVLCAATLELDILICSKGLSNHLSRFLQSVQFREIQRETTTGTATRNRKTNSLSFLMSLDPKLSACSNYFQSGGTIRKVREVKKMPEETLVTLPNVVKQDCHQNEDPKQVQI